MLNWWLSQGGIPGNIWIHEKFDDKPLTIIPGMKDKFNAILSRIPSNQKGLTIKALYLTTLFLGATTHLYGNYSIKESQYAGDDFAEGIMQDPETLYYPLMDRMGTKTIGIVELYGKTFSCLFY